MKNKTMASSPQRIYDGARYAILGLVLITVLNVFLSFVESDSYYVSSVFASYFVSVVFEGALRIIVPLAILAPFVVAFFLSKKSHVWMIVALVLTVLDLLFVIYIGVALDILVYHILDILAHIFVIVLLVLGVINGIKLKKEAEAAEEAAAHPGETQERTSENGDEGPFTDVVCTVSVSEDGTKHSLETPGIARFYENELALGTNNMGMSIAFGSAFASTKERMRFAYTDIARACFAKKNERTVRIDLSDGRYAFLVLTNAARDQLAELLSAHGVTIEPFAE